MQKHLRTFLILLTALSVVVASSPASFADKKNNSNSNSDDKKDKDKDRDDSRRDRGDRNKNDNKNDNKNNQNDNQKPNGQNVQKFQQNNPGKQGNSNNGPNIILGNPQGNNSLQKSQQNQNGQKQLPNMQKLNSQPQNGQKIDKNVQLPGIQNKPDWIAKSKNNQKDVKNYVGKFGGPEPFSKKWYNDHPKAWHSGHHHHDNDTWKVITAAGVVGFLGWELYQPRTVVVYQPVAYDTLFITRPGVVIDPNQGDWMPLGQFSLMTGPGDNSTRMIDLGVDRFGHIRGSYYDMISGASHNVAGIVDSRTQYAQWSLESNRQLTFYTPLGELMQPQGSVYVQLPSGERQQWQVVRIDNTGY